MQIGVLQMVDSLLVGGAERMGVTLANLLPRERYRSFLCVTRAGGPLEEFVAGHVGRLDLNRKGRIDWSAVLRTVRFIRENKIAIIHAHASSLFFARLVAMLPPFPKLIWHDHDGRCELNERPARVYRAATAGIGGIIAVNDILMRWATETLGRPGNRVWFIRNAVEMPENVAPASNLPGKPGKRVVCVANLRAQKDHPTLLHAMVALVKEDPERHLILVGAAVEPPQTEKVFQLIKDLHLSDHVTYLGARTDVPNIVAGCDVAVLSSISEGLPLVLLEFGSLRKPVVCTAVGQCPEVLDHGKAGVLVPAGDANQIATELSALLECPARRAQLGSLLHDRVRAMFGIEGMLEQLSAVYETVLTGAPPRPEAGGSPVHVVERGRVSV